MYTGAAVWNVMYVPKEIKNGTTMIQQSLSWVFIIKT
jgi:hypothetical protein